MSAQKRLFNMRSRAALGFLLCLACAGGRPAAADNKGIALSVDGVPAAVIVVPDQAQRSESYAAEVLQKYLEKISGARLEIVPEGRLDAKARAGLSRVHVGAVRAAAKLSDRLGGRDRDAFLVRGGADGLYLLGAEPRATVYAVYDFLEQELGCRWLGPGELWEEIPERPTLTAAVRERIEEPGMKYRIDYAMDLHPESDWALQRKINVPQRRFTVPFEWIPERHRLGEPLPVDVRGWTHVHGAPVILRALGLEQSEWFAVNEHGGRRLNSICFSNPEVHDLLAERLSQLLRERPEYEFVELGAVDGLSLRYCRCGHCMKWDRLEGSDFDRLRGRLTHRWLALINAVAERLAETDPGRYLMAAAYSVYQQPPDPEIIKPADNVIITYWTWTDCRVHGFEHVDGEEEPLLSETLTHAGTREWLDTWRENAPGGVIVSDYIGRVAMHGMTGANPRRYVENLRYLHRRGITGFKSFNAPTPTAFFLVNRYAAARAMWDPDIDADELVRDFCRHAFHSAADDMLRFIDVIEAAMREAPCSHMNDIAWMTAENIAKARPHLNAASAAAEGDEKVEKRLLSFKLHLRLMELAGPAYQLWLRVVTGERDPELLRRAIRKIEEAGAYQDEMSEKYPDVLLSGISRLRAHVRENGSWRRLLEQLEREQE